MGFGVNMKVVDNCVSLLMPLVYRTWVMVKLLHVDHNEIFMNFSTTFPEFEMKTAIDRYRIGLWCKNENDLWRENDFWFLSYD